MQTCSFCGEKVIDNLIGSVESDAGCQFRGHKFGHNYFRLTTFIGLTVDVEKQQVDWKDCCVDFWCKKANKHMSWCTGRRDMAKELL